MGRIFLPFFFLPKVFDNCAPLKKKFWEVHYLFSHHVLDRNAPNKFVIDWIMFKIKAKVLQNGFFGGFWPCE